MPSPFPGMDPYLEDPDVWPSFHSRFIADIQEILNRLIRPKYVARIEERVYMVPDDDPEYQLRRVPDLQLSTVFPERDFDRQAVGTIDEPVIVRQREPSREGRVEILEVGSREVVTVIEVLSPSNKLQGAAGRDSFLKKRQDVIASAVNWVEIDLLRDGVSHPSKSSRFRRCQYLVFSSPSATRPDGKAWGILLTQRLPIVGVPLRAPDPDVPLDLQDALNTSYDRAAYDATTDYKAEPNPLLPPKLAKWADGVLKAKGLR